jgi:hypothetical protein
MSIRDKARALAQQLTKKGPNTAEGFVYTDAVSKIATHGVEKANLDQLLAIIPRTEESQERAIRFAQQSFDSATAVAAFAAEHDDLITAAQKKLVGLSE